MQERQHKTFPEGIATGLVGAVVVAVWYLVLDIGRGRPLYTPNVLGQVFVGRDTLPTPHIVPQAVAEFSLLHLFVFIILGIGLVGLTHLASRNPSLRMGVWLGLVVGFVFFLGHLVMLSSLTRERLPWLTTFGGAVLGIGSMALYLWKRHPRLRGSFDQAPLGAEVKPPPHPPGVSRR